MRKTLAKAKRGCYGLRFRRRVFGVGVLFGVPALECILVAR
jgi:hypothetical protein